MIPRYTREAMAAVWSEERKYGAWLDVELAALDAWGELGSVPLEAVRRIRGNARLDPARIAEIERVTRHDVIAFVEQVGETIGADAAFLHYGLTSSDILDTSLALILREAGAIILEDLRLLAAALAAQALAYRDLVVMGRTHGVHAEPLTLGYRIAGWRQEALRNIARVEAAVAEVSVGKLSGAVGAYTSVDPAVEERVCAALGLKPERFATQVVARDRHASFLSALALAAACAERIALQVRLLQQTEIGELAEPFRAGQKGSSAMPHKRNPILCERVCGLARVVKKNASAGLDNAALWYERDISHSSAERVILPESCILLDYLLHLLTGVIADLRVFPEAVERNLRAARGLTSSQAVLTRLVEKGLARKEAYELVQQCAFAALAEGIDFRAALARNRAVTDRLAEDEIAACFDTGRLLRFVADAFEREGA